MDGVLFEDLVREIPRKFEAEQRKVVRIVEYCPAHPLIDDQNAINLVFLPPNPTSHTQPMDQRVVRSLKAKYRHLVVQKYLTSLELKEGILKISILHSTDMLVSAWSMVADETTDSVPSGDDILGEFLYEKIEDSEQANELAEEIAKDIGDAIVCFYRKARK